MNSHDSSPAQVFSLLFLHRFLMGLYPCFTFFLRDNIQPLSRSSTILGTMCHWHFISTFEFSLLTKFLLTILFPVLYPQFPIFLLLHIFFAYIYICIYNVLKLFLPDVSAPNWDQFLSQTRRIHLWMSLSSSCTITADASKHVPCCIMSYVLVTIAPSCIQSLIPLEHKGNFRTS